MLSRAVSLDILFFGQTGRVTHRWKEIFPKWRRIGSDGPLVGNQEFSHL